jgi:SAM-dependent methyltransferase
MKKRLQTIKTYNQSAAAMAKKFNGMEGYLPDIERTFSFAPQKQNPKVVEVGSGSGRDARDLLKFTNDYLGFDISPEMVRHAKKLVPNANFIVADIDDFSFPKKADAIFAFASLLHSNKKSLAKIIDRVYEALKEKGVIFMSLKYGEYQEDTRTDEFGTRTYYYYTPEIIKELAGDKFQTVFKERKKLKNQEWFSIILQKLF